MGLALEGKRAFIAGVADDGGFGFAIARALAEAGCKVSVGTWPPALGIFETMLARGKLDASRRLSDGSLLSFELIVPLDADYDSWEDVPEEVRTHRRYRDRGDFTVSGAARRCREAFGEHAFEVVVHAIANGPEVRRPLLETSRKGYLAALSTSAYSFVSLVRHFGPLVRPGGSFITISYLAAERVVPGYGGGMSSAKAALESDTRVLAYEAGRRWGHRVNAISAGPFASRAASAIGTIGKMITYYAHASPLEGALTAQEVADVALFLASPLSRGLTGCVLHVDRGYHSMGVPHDLERWVDALFPPASPQESGRDA
ncbi:MAG: enoyl-[acyl-carrier-protein] reductase [Deltaproteobacteria bacterium]|nr:enoyl-[acyl-carrier-protein] reductase [Deltaproteobacteria bacterium]